MPSEKISDAPEKRHGKRCWVKMDSKSLMLEKVAKVEGDQHKSRLDVFILVIYMNFDEMILFH